MEKTLIDGCYEVLAYDDDYNIVEQSGFFYYNYEAEEMAEKYLTMGYAHVVMRKSEDWEYTK